MTDDTAAAIALIRAARAQSNAGIAAHDVEQATAPMLPEARFVVSHGALWDGLEVMKASFQRAFDDPTFEKFVRTPVSVEIGRRGAAVENGRWVGTWPGHKTTSGHYMARWNKVGGAWMIAAEMYVPMDCEGPDC